MFYRRDIENRNDASGENRNDSMGFLQFSDFGVKCFLGHNFGSRHAKWSINGSIDSGDHAISKQGLSQNFGSLDWRPGLFKVGQK